MQMRALCNQILEESAARHAALANRQALMDAATQKALSDHNSDNGGHQLTPQHRFHCRRSRSRTTSSSKESSLTVEMDREPRKSQK
jgi:hypothetical protein